MQLVATYGRHTVDCRQEQRECYECDVWAFVVALFVAQN